MDIPLKQDILSFSLIRLNCRVHILCVTEVKWCMQMNWRLSYLTSALLPCPEYWIFNTLVTVIAIYSKTIRDLCWRRCAHKDYTSLEDGTHNSGLWTQYLLLLTSCRTKDAWPTFHLMLLLTQTSKQAQTIFVTFWRISDHLWQPYCYYIASGWVSTSLSTGRGKFLGIVPVSVISSFSPLDAKSKVYWQFYRSTYVIQSHKQLSLCINGTFFVCV